MSQTKRVSGVATSLVRNTGFLGVRYHDTMVAGVDLLGNVTLDSGGWWTATTKLRMNQFANQFGLPYGVYQHKGQWYVDLRERHETLVFDTRMVRFNVWKREEGE